MPTNHTRRRATALATATALTAGVISHLTVPAAAATPPGTGNTTDAIAAETVIYVAADLWDIPDDPLDDGDEIIEYRPGTGSDWIWYDFDHTSSSAFYQPEPTGAINSVYQPFAGDFDGDGFDEVVWYAPGTGTDIMWDSNPTARDSITPITLDPINNTYLTAVGDFDGDGGDDVFWYNPNTNQTDEQYWDFNLQSPTPLKPIGSTSPYGVSNNEWIPYGGDFSSDGADDLAWYRKTTGAVWRWNFAPSTSALTKAGADTQLGTVNTNITEAVTLDRARDGRTDIMWYTTGTTVDPYWNYDANGNRTIINQTNNQTYDLTSGNFFQNNNPASNNDNDNSGDDVLLRGTASYFHNYYVDDNSTTQLQILSAGGASAALTTALDQAATTNITNGQPNTPIKVTVYPHKTTVQTNGRTFTVDN